MKKEAALTCHASCSLTHGLPHLPCLESISLALSPSSHPSTSLLSPKHICHQALGSIYDGFMLEYSTHNLSICKISEITGLKNVFKMSIYKRPWGWVILEDSFHALSEWFVLLWRDEQRQTLGADLGFCEGGSGILTHSWGVEACPHLHLPS